MKVVKVEKKAAVINKSVSDTAQKTQARSSGILEGIALTLRKILTVLGAPMGALSSKKAPPKKPARVIENSAPSAPKGELNQSIPERIKPKSPDHRLKAGKVETTLPSPIEDLSKDDKTPLNPPVKRKVGRPRLSDKAATSKSGDSMAEKAQEEAREKKSESSIVKIAKAMAVFSGGSSAAIGGLADNESVNDVGVATGGVTYAAAKQTFDGVRNLKTAFTDLKSGISDAGSSLKQSVVGVLGKTKLGQAFLDKAAARKKLKLEVAAIKKREAIEKKAQLKKERAEKAFLKTKEKADRKALKNQNIEITPPDQEEVGSALEAQTKKLKKAIEDNAGAGGSSGGIDFGDTLSGIKKFLPSMAAFAKGVPLLGGLVAGGLKFFDVKDDESLTTNQKAVQVGATGGGALAGGLSGAAAGAALGSIVPIVGTALGGVIGGAIGTIGGAFGGDWLGDTLSSFMDSPEEVAEKQKAQAVRSAEVDRAPKQNPSASIVVPQESKPAVALAKQEKAGYLPAKPIVQVKPFKPKQNDQLSPMALNGSQKASQAQAIPLNPDDVSRPIVKALEKLNGSMARNEREAFQPIHIPMEFDSTLLTLMSHDRI